MGVLQPCIGGEFQPNWTKLSDNILGPEMELPTDDLNDILHDEEDDNSINILKDQSCHYFEPEEVHQKLDAKSFSLYSHNIRSLSGHFNDLKDSLYSMLPATFSVIALQEVWSISKCYDLTGYSQIIYKTRDMNNDPNPNCGGGVGVSVSLSLYICTFATSS